MSRRRFLIYTTATLLLLSVPLNSPLAKDKISARIEKETETLKELNRQIENNKKELSRLKKKEDSITNRLNKIDRRIQLTDNEISVLRIQLNKNRKEGEKIRSERKTTKEAITKNSTILSKNMQRLHKEGHFSFMKALLSSRSFSDFLRRARYSRILAKEEAKVLNNQRKEEKNLRTIQIKLNTTENKIKKLIGSISSKKITALKEKKKKRKMLKDIAIKREVYLKHKKEAETSSKELLSLLEKLKKKKQAGYVAKRGSANFAKMRGRLPWPIAGKIVSSYGKIKNPKFNVYTFSNGIEIRTKPNRQIKAVHNGKVIFSDWFKGYGKLVIVDNGGGYYSLYGHLNKIEAQIGDNVYSGNVLGYSGETGSIHGHTLYFEIRKDGKPVNPLKWLNKKRKVA